MRFTSTYHWVYLGLFCLKDSVLKNIFQFQQLLSWNIGLSMKNFTYQVAFESCKLNNIVDFSHLETNTHSMPHLGLIILFIVSLIMLETLGNFLLFCMVWYEKYGMDSKKRTISNQLLSRMIIVMILFNIIMMPLITLGQILGAFSEYLILIWAKAICFSKTNSDSTSLKEFYYHPCQLTPVIRPHTVIFKYFNIKE